MLQDFTDISSISKSQLTEEEALQLADELSGKLSEGEIPKSDAESLKRMVAGLGDARGALRLTFAKSLGAVGYEALPILCKALRQHQNVVVRRASAKTLNLIGNKDALPYLLEAFLKDDDPVVLGSSAGAMATIGPDAMDSLLGILKNPDCTPFQVGLINLALSFIGSKAPEALLEAADSDVAEVRVAAISALGDQIQKSDNLRAQNRVFQALEDVSADVRAEAVTLIGKSCDAEDVETLLLKKLSDEDTQVRKNTALSLMKLDALGAIEQLKMAEKKEDDPDVKAVLKVAINILSAKND
ncbi:HEAT repeat domain-containing protein [Synechococcus sp. RS9902]|uniref:HEAT repeat domain-containing protein n=1 Tax=Synechococcus sp. RS9902 TaxID=221345 RepID=UPI0009C3D351|nr:HEAT repeat domain-containing protein [Synechococcus sp. RS9902]AQY63494.1 putative phycoerythrobilin:C-phycoerythrin lyase-isomerase [Synechococcus sp. RS9902]QNI96358.1 putative phycoerythrobilin:C-phycoerythrin II lyase-isomerase [Synechococcus sp. RS9902]